VIFAMLHRPKGGRQLEIHLKGPGFPPREMGGQFRQIAGKWHGKGVKIRIWMSLVLDLAVGNKG
jgi:hypothetical protein